MKGRKDWQSNIIDELLYIREDSLNANLNKEEIQIMLNETACGRFWYIEKENVYDDFLFLFLFFYKYILLLYIFLILYISNMIL